MCLGAALMFLSTFRMDNFLRSTLPGDNTTHRDLLKCHGVAFNGATGRCDAAVHATCKGSSLRLYFATQTHSDSCFHGAHVHVQAEYTCQPEGVWSNCHLQALPFCPAIKAPLAD